MQAFSTLPCSDTRAILVHRVHTTPSCKKHTVVCPNTLHDPHALQHSCVTWSLCLPEVCCHAEGVSLAGDLSIPAESAFLQAEASAATYSSSRLSSRSHSPLPQTPPDSSMLLEAALSPELGVDTIPHYGALHQLHAGSSFGSGNMCKIENCHPGNAKGALTWQ